VVHIDADKIGHALLAGDLGVMAEIESAFGSDVVSPEGGIDRKKLGRKVFSDERLVKKLNAIMHPAIIAMITDRIAELEQSGVRMVVLDAALLLEVGLPFEPDVTIAFRCPAREQVRRLREAGLCERDIELRLRNQENLERSFRKADYVVDTDKPLAEVLAEVDGIIEREFDSA